MTPQTVNAYYNPRMNEIVFPAGILQPPFFDLDADDAVNYGAIGAVIGHEIGHGFDDQGSRYDGDGNLNDWWTDDDRAAFEQRTDKLVAQYDVLSPAETPGQHVNGKLTLGENIGDLGGLSIAYVAYQLSLDGAEAPVVDGLTGSQRFFASWAHAWSTKTRPGRGGAPAGDRPALAAGVPLQRGGEEHRRVPHHLRDHRGRRHVAVARGPRPHLVTPAGFAAYAAGGRSSVVGELSVGARRVGL